MEQPTSFTDDKTTGYDQPRFLTKDEAYGRFLKSLEAKDARRVFRSGFASHDLTAGKFQRGGFYVIAARPGVGKTAFTIALAYLQERSGVTTYYITLEMRVEQLWSRLACIHDKNLKLSDFLDDKVPDHLCSRIVATAGELRKFSPLFFEDSNWNGIERALIENISRSSDSIVFLDYLGLCSARVAGADTRYALISYIALRIKRLALALDVPFIVACQLNREIEKRQNKRAILADLADSGDIEKHADAIFILTRENKEVLDVDIAKNRYGATSAYALSFDGPRVTVEEL